MIVLVQQGCRNGKRVYSQDRVEVTLFFLLTSVISTGNIKQLQANLCYIYSNNVKYIRKVEINRVDSHSNCLDRGISCVNGLFLRIKMEVHIV